MNYAHPSNGCEVGNGPSPAVPITFAPSPCLSPMLVPSAGIRTPLGFAPGGSSAGRGPGSAGGFPATQIVLVKMRFDLHQLEPVENMSPLGWW